MKATHTLNLTQLVPHSVGLRSKHIFITQVTLTWLH